MNTILKTFALSIALFVSLGTLANADKERAVHSWCRDDWGNLSGKELMVGAEGDLSTMTGSWAISLIDAKTKNECQLYSVSLNKKLKKISYQDFCAASFTCKKDNDGTTRLYISYGNKKLSLITMIGSSDKARDQNCTQIQYNLEQHLDRCN